MRVRDQPGNSNEQGLVQRQPWWMRDLRGITDTLEESNHLLGLLRFKAGTGGQAVGYLGEWDYPLNKILHKALDFYMSRH